MIMKAKRIGKQQPPAYTPQRVAPGSPMHRHSPAINRKAPKLTGEVIRALINPGKRKVTMERRAKAVQVENLTWLINQLNK